MENIEQSAVEILSKLEKLATGYTPDVLSSITACIQITAIGHLIWEATLLTIYFTILRKSIINTLALIEKLDREAIVFFVFFYTFLLMFIFLLGSINQTLFPLVIFDAWTWAAIFDPKLALAHKVLGL